MLESLSSGFISCHTTVIKLYINFFFRRLVSVRENRCCSRISCECQACEELQNCSEGWEYDDVHDDCGCIIRTCIQPVACIYEGARCVIFSYAYLCGSRQI